MPKKFQSSEEQGLPVLIRTIPFTNNDVPEFLERLHKFEKESGKAEDIIARGYQPAYQQASQDYSASAYVQLG